MSIVGTGTRILNFLIDITLISAIAFGVHRGYTFYVFYYHIPYLPIFYSLAATGFLYYLFFEAIWQRTPGKWLSLSKVANRNGGKPSFTQILVRSAMRVIGAIVIDSIFLSFLGKTLHDYVSKTEVIEV